MKVFLVLEDFGYEGFDIAAVYTNRAAAKEKVKILESDNPSWNIRIEEKDLLDE